MSFLKSLAAAFKGADDRVPLARSFASPWAFADGGTRSPFEYAGAVKRAYLDNPVAQRAVRLVSEGIGGAPLLPTDPKLAALVTNTSAGYTPVESCRVTDVEVGQGQGTIASQTAPRPEQGATARSECEPSAG